VKPQDAARSLVDAIITAYNKRDTVALAALYQPEITYWSALDGTQKGIDRVLAHVDFLHETLPDEQMRAKTVVTDGDLVVVEFESTGTNPVGRPYTIEFTEVYELRDGRVASIKVYLDPEDIERAMG